MKKIISILVLSLLLACSSSDDIYRYNIKNVRYFSSTINHIENRIVTLRDGSKWKTNRIVTAVNMMPVFVLLEEYINSGYFYLNNTKIGVTGGRGNEMQYKRGFLNSIKNIIKDGHSVELIDGSIWATPDTALVNQWNVFPEIVITEDEGYFINTMKNEFIRVVKTSSDREQNL